MISNLLLNLRISRFDESVEIMAENQVMLQCVSVIEQLHGEEGKIRKGIKKRSINDYHIIIFRC